MHEYVCMSVFACVCACMCVHLYYLQGSHKQRFQVITLCSNGCSLSVGLLSRSANTCMCVCVSV
jgi:hypothetical protein